MLYSLIIFLSSRLSSPFPFITFFLSLFFFFLRPFASTHISTTSNLTPFTPKSLASFENLNSPPHHSLYSSSSLFSPSLLPFYIYSSLFPISLFFSNALTFLLILFLLTISPYFSPPPSSSYFIDSLYSPLSISSLYPFPFLLICAWFHHLALPYFSSSSTSSISSSFSTSYSSSSSSPGSSSSNFKPLLPFSPPPLPSPSLLLEFSSSQSFSYSPPSLILLPSNPRPSSTSS